MKNNDHSKVEPLSQRKSSVRIAKSNETSDPYGAITMDSFIKRIFGGKNQKSIFYISLSFFICSFLTWQVNSFAGNNIYTPENGISSFWSWLNDTSFFFSIMFLGLGLVSAFVYLTRRF